jgi:hypothetical protein
MFKWFETGIEIVAHMLDVANTFTDQDPRCGENPVIKLNAMYRGHYNHSQLAEYVHVLMENELLLNKEPEHRCKITEKDYVFCAFTTIVT